MVKLEVNAKAQKIDEPGKRVEEITFTDNVFDHINIHEQTNDENCE